MTLQELSCSNTSYPFDEDLCTDNSSSSIRLAERWNRFALGFILLNSGVGSRPWWRFYFYYQVPSREKKKQKTENRKTVDLSLGTFFSGLLREPTYVKRWFPAEFSRCCVYQVPPLCSLGLTISPRTHGRSWSSLLLWHPTKMLLFAEFQNVDDLRQAPLQTQNDFVLFFFVFPSSFFIAFNYRDYCTISIDSAVTRHRACGLGRIRSPVPRHNPDGRRFLVDPKNGQKGF